LLEAEVGMAEVMLVLLDALVAVVELLMFALVEQLY
jgi:hypothetical protein